MRGLLAATAMALVGMAFAGPAMARTNYGLLVAVTDYPNLPKKASLLLYSDGAIEIERSDGRMANQEELTRFASEQRDWSGVMDSLIARTREIRRQPVLADDCSLMQIGL